MVVQVTSDLATPPPSCFNVRSQNIKNNSNMTEKLCSENIICDLNSQTKDVDVDDSNFSSRERLALTSA